MSLDEELSGRLKGLLAQGLSEEEVEGEGSPLIGILDRYLSRPASLLRPRLLLATAEAYGGRSESEPLRRLAAATELLHLFALMHDDAVDQDERRGVQLPPQPERLPALLLTGDLLHSLAISVIETTVESYSLSRRILTQVRSVSLRTIVGQSRDLSFLNTPGSGELPRRAALFRLYDLKTGYYSFVAPATIGALAAGSEDIRGLEEIALILGRAYQLRDDHLDALRLLENGGYSEARRWELNLLAVLLAEEGQRGLAERILAGRRQDEEIRRAAEALLRGGAVDRVQAELLEAARSRAADLAPPVGRGTELLERLITLARLS